MGSRGVVGGGLLLFLALALLLLPLNWVIAAIAAAAIHELSHYAAVRLCGGEAHWMHIGLYGAQMEVRLLTPGKELLCALAGPLGGLLLLLFARWFPRTAICGGLHALFNLLPVYPLDGGRALRCGVELLLPAEIGDKVCNVIEWICLIGVLLLGIYGTVALHLGLLPIILSFSLVIRAFRGKIPCKPMPF